jgi:carbon monoxide dehydrogenase subunit G
MRFKGRTVRHRAKERNMFVVEDSIEVRVTPEQAFAWLADLDNLPRFQSGVFKSELLTPRPTRIGTRFREAFRMMGIPMTAECEVIELSPPSVMGFSGVGRRMDYQSRFALEPAPGGARITHRAAVTMRGPWKLLGLLMKAEGAREIKAEHQRLKAAMESDYGVKLALAGQPKGRAQEAATREL